MAFEISEFTGNMRFGGARPSLFEVNISNPINAAADDRVRFSCTTANIPGTTLGVITQNYFGRPVKFAGNRTYEDWTVTIINDEDFSIRSTLEQWVQAINGTTSNLASVFNNTYKSRGNVIHYGKAGDTLRTYDVEGLFPTSIEPISLDWGNADALETYTVTFSMDFWTTQSGGLAPGAAII